jgi:chemotaxis protein histidine kinase CheA
MKQSERELLQKLRSTFRSEAPVKLRMVRRILYEAFKKNSGDGKADLLRELHNLKGISRIASMSTIQALCELSERLLRSHEFPPPAEIYEAVMEALQIIEELLPCDESESTKYDALRARLEQLVKTN